MLAVLIALLLMDVAVVLDGFGPVSIVHAATPEAEWETYRDDEYGWRLRYPPRRIQPFADDIGHSAFMKGVLVSNLDDFDFRHPSFPNEWTSEWDMRGTPPETAVVQFGFLTGGLTFCEPERSARPRSRPPAEFPLSLDEAKTVHDPVEGRPLVQIQPHLYIETLVRNDQHFGVSVWFGSDASARDREVVASIVSSISEPSRTPCDEIRASYRNAPSPIP